MAGKRAFENIKDWDSPPHSRLFIVCPKSTLKEELTEAFEKYGKIEDVWIIKDKVTGNSKGIAFIKFSKTSEAFIAMEEMNDRTLPSHSKCLKVLIAQSNKNDGTKREVGEQEKMLRLFIVFPKSIAEPDVREHFKQFEGIEFINILKDKSTGKSKGCGFIKFKKESQAAKAMEECDPKYKAVFAEPKPPVMTLGDVTHMNRDRLARIERLPRADISESRLSQLYGVRPRADLYGVSRDGLPAYAKPYTDRYYEDGVRSRVSDVYRAQQTSPSELEHVNKSLGALQSQLANLASITQTLAQTTSLIQAAALGKSSGRTKAEQINPSYAPARQSQPAASYGYAKYADRESAVDATQSPYYQYVVREQVRMVMPDSYRDVESGSKRQRFGL